MSNSSKKGKRKPAWATSVSDYVSPCKGCPGFYKGEIRSVEGGILQVMSCRDECPKVR